MHPILFQSHDLILYSYPLIMGLGWGVAYQIFFSKLDDKLPHIKAQILFWGIFLFAWLGAKILFAITIPKNDVNFINQLSFWTGGGFVFYGGFLGALLFLIIYKMIDRKFNFITLWPVLPALAIGHAIGRIGCLLAGCCFGKPTELFWGIYLHDHYRHPTQIVEATGLFLIGLYLLKSKLPRLILLSHYLVFYGCLRFWIESLRGDQVRGHWGYFTPSQWISLLLIVAGFFLFFGHKFKTLQPSK